MPQAPPPGSVIDAEVVTPSTSDPMQRLKTLKEMLDAGLITHAVFTRDKLRFRVARADVIVSRYNRQGGSNQFGI